MTRRFGSICGRYVALLLGLGVTLSTGSIAVGNDYPVRGRPVKIIVPYPPGGPGDIVARALAEYLRTQLNATFVIENKPGSSQIVATLTGVRSAPDGHTILMGSATSLAINPILKKSLPYDPLRDLEPISMVINSPQYLITRPDFPANSIGELIDLARKSPGKLSYASLGPGSTQNISGELLNVKAGISITHVPYTGAAAMVRDVAAGHVSMTYTTGVLNLIRSKQVKALGVTSAARTTLAPEIMPIAEFGMPDFEVAMWQGFALPAGTPKPIVDVLYGAIKQAVESGALQSRMGVAGAEYEFFATAPDEFRKFIQQEIARTRQMVALAKLTAD